MFQAQVFTLYPEVFPGPLSKGLYGKALSNKLLKQFKMMSEMMKKMSKGNLKGMSDKGIPPELFNQLK